MPGPEIKRLRQEGHLEEALALATEELVPDPENIYARRNKAWVHYAFLKQHAASNEYDNFLHHLVAIKELAMPDDEQILFDQIGWQAGRMIFNLAKTEPEGTTRPRQLFELLSGFNFSRPSEVYSFLFKAFHKIFKPSKTYIQFADWWDLDHFRHEDYQKDKLPNGQEVMAIAEQGFINYAKHILPSVDANGELFFDLAKAMEFMPRLKQVCKRYPQLVYPPYFYAKLLLAVGVRDQLETAILPFVKKKRNDFWAWEILAEAFPDDEDKVLACYCKGLSCPNPNEMKVGLREKLASLLIARNQFAEAKTEIEQILAIKQEKGHRVPNQITQWKNKAWYNETTASESNTVFYQQHAKLADTLLYADVPEKKVFVEYVNSNRHILNFILSESKHGFFRYDRFIDQVSPGDILLVRFQNLSTDNISQVLTVRNITDESFKQSFMKKAEGIVSIRPGQSFGFLEDVFIHPKLVSKLNLSDGMAYSGTAMKSFNKDKNQWGWKLVE